jgi:putative component of toxin-antitoxin plasmid stabilization module
LDLDRPQRAHIEERLERVRLGNLGNYRDLLGGLFELKFGNGFRTRLVMDYKIDVPEEILSQQILA